MRVQNRTASLPARLGGAEAIQRSVSWVGWFSRTRGLVASGVRWNPDGCRASRSGRGSGQSPGRRRSSRVIGPEAYPPEASLLVGETSPASRCRGVGSLAVAEPGGVAAGERRLSGLRLCQRPRVAGLQRYEVRLAGVMVGDCYRQKSLELARFSGCTSLSRCGLNLVHADPPGQCD